MAVWSYHLHPKSSWKIMRCTLVGTSIISTCVAKMYRQCRSKRLVIQKKIKHIMLSDLCWWYTVVIVQIWVLLLVKVASQVALFLRRYKRSYWWVCASSWISAVNDISSLLSLDEVLALRSDLVLTPYALSFACYSSDLILFDTHSQGN